MTKGSHAAPPRGGGRTLPIAAAIATVVALSLAWMAVTSRAGPDGPPGDANSPPGHAPTLSPVPSPVVTGVGLPFHIEVSHLRFVDESRSIRVSGSEVPRVLRTVLWYPLAGSESGTPVPSSDSRPRDASFPLVVFGHGFDLDPLAYRPLLRAWARAGYIVAAPIFPLTSPGASGGLNESDVVNQPGDVSFVISRLLALSARPSSRLSGLIDPSRIGVAGHSDGAETALTVAYDRCCRDRRIRVAVIMAGAELYIAGGLPFASPGPPLLAVQGTADMVNRPELTTQLYADASAPKYGLWLRGGDHVSPYIGRDRYEAIVQRITLAFLDRYLKLDTYASIRLPPKVRRSGLAALRVEV